VLLPGEEIRVSSWGALTAMLHSERIIPRLPDEGNHFRSPCVFRGVDVATWGLQTSLQRLTSEPNRIEQAVLRSFRKYANDGAFDKESEWYMLAVAQHNGLPTRCLDWTASPLVAAHFACGDEKYKDVDGAIWCLNLVALRKINEQNHPGLHELKQIFWVYDTRRLEETFRNLKGLDSSAQGKDLMLLWEPPSLDQRIASQRGYLSVMNSPGVSQTSFLQSHSQNASDLVVRIVIDAAMKSEARDMLDQNNICERSLFPGLPGLCAWLKRYYGAAWPPMPSGSE